MPKEKKPKAKKQFELKSPRGVHDIMGEEYFSYQGFFEKAEEIALYYGFQPIETPILEQEELFTRSVGEFSDIAQKEMYTLRTRGGDKLALRPEGTAPIIRAYAEHGMHTRPQPVLLYYRGPFFRHDKPQRGRFREFRQFGVEAIGSDKSIVDALIIRLFLAILEEVGITNLTVDVNSLGDKECRTEYKKALVAYFRKHTGKLNTEGKALLKNNPLRLLDSKDPVICELKDEAPETMEFLQGPSKQHFKEVLEYLDSMDVNYRINGNLVRGLDYYSRTVFEIVETQEDAENENDSDEKEGEKKKEKKEEQPRALELGGGGRYDLLGKMLGTRRPLPAVGGALGVDRILMHEKVKKLDPRIIKKPKVFFIQLGFDAKLKSLPLIDNLRHAKIPIQQSLSKDKLSVQLASVEKLGVPWVIILGEKEVIDGTVMVRDMHDRSQKTVKQEELVTYLKKHIARA